VGLGTSLFLIAIGAILRFAVTVSGHGVNLHTVGVILMVVGAAGLVISLFWLAMAADRRGGRVVARDEAVPPARDLGPRY
jgi:uncharacterized membrane protein